MAYEVKVYDPDMKLKYIVTPEMLAEIAEKRFKKEFDGIRVIRNGKRLIEPLKGYNYKIDADMIK